VKMGVLSGSVFRKVWFISNGLKQLSIERRVNTFTRVRKIAKKRLLASSCLSVCPHETTRFPLDGFS